MLTNRIFHAPVFVVIVLLQACLTRHACTKIFYSLTFLKMKKLFHLTFIGATLLPLALYAEENALTETVENNAISAQVTQNRNPDDSFANTWQPGQISVSMDNHYYNWKGDDNKRGSQYVVPLNLSYQNGAFNVGVRRAYIDSRNKSPEQKGKVADWSDTSVSMAYTFFQDKNFPVRFNLSANIPNGKATLYGDEKNAIMDSNLVWQTRFGEGFNLTPGINIAHSFTNKDTVGFGVSRVIRGEFDPNGDVENDEFEPGDDTIATLQYSHTGQRVQVQTGLSYQHSAVTLRGNHPYYQKGDLWSADINAQFALTQNQTVYGGYSYAYRKKDKYINNLTGDLEIEQFNSNGATHYANLGYVLSFKRKHSIGTSADYLKVKSNSYDQINALFMPARTKVGIGMNYNYKITPNTQLSLSAKRFKMKDEATPYLARQNYRGWNVFGSLKHQF